MSYYGLPPATTDQIEAWSDRLTALKDVLAARKAFIPSPKP